MQAARLPCQRRLCFPLARPDPSLWHRLHLGGLAGEPSPASCPAQRNSRKPRGLDSLAYPFQASAWDYEWPLSRLAYALFALAAPDLPVRAPSPLQLADIAALL